MPELAEVEWYRKEWDAGKGAKVVGVDLHSRKRIFRGADTRELRSRSIGATFLKSEARGKRMLFRFSNNVWLGIHLGMTGRLSAEKPGFRGDKHDHLILRQEKRALVFRDSRQFGRVRFHHGANPPDWWDENTPEIVSGRFDRRWLDHVLDRHARAPIKAVLLMQNAFSGIGNWMADEILWRANLLPARRVSSLGKNDRAKLLRETKLVARRSLKTLGQDYSDPPDDWLIHQRWKTGGVCPKHGIALKRATVAGRTTVWCPRCQR